MRRTPPSPLRSVLVGSALGLVLGASGCGALLPGEGGSDAGGTGTTGQDGGTAAVEPKLSSLYASYFKQCGSCHAPSAPGRTSDIEQTLDFTSTATAHTTITTGMAKGLVGNHAGCNGAPFLRPTAAESLILAVVDQPTRQAFDLTGMPTCDESAISDETVKVGSPPPSGFVVALRTWIEAGAPND